MPRPGDVVTVDFSGATGIKRRPAIVVSSDVYHAERPDVVLGVITSNVSNATSSTDYLLADWSTSGLKKPSAFRSYFAMALPGNVRVIGHVSDRDWQSIRERVHRALA
jgi:mRNA interferase MazF